MLTTQLEELFSVTADSSITLGSALLGLFAALLLGFLMSLTYMKASRTGHSQDLMITITILPAVVAIIIMLVGSNLARAFSLGGVFTLIRFRSNPGRPKDISFIFLSAGVGLACGLGYIAYAFLFGVILSVVLFIMLRTDFGAQKTCAQSLKITIPEDLDYKGVFDDLLKQYTKSYTLKRVRTAELGTLFELNYIVTMGEEQSEKDFIDMLRCRNGNLPISLSLKEDDNDGF